MDKKCIFYPLYLHIQYHSFGVSKYIFPNLNHVNSELNAPQLTKQNSDYPTHKLIAVFCFCMCHYVNTYFIK